MKKLFLLLLAIVLLAGCVEPYDGPTEAQPRLVEYHATHYYHFFGWEDEQQTYRTVYAYDIYGNQVQYMEYRGDELYSVTKLRYDDRGNEISRTIWDHSGWIPKFNRRTEQTFDGQDRLLSYVTYDFWGRQEGGGWYTYDDENGIRTYQDETGEVLQTTWYDESGRDIRQTAGEYETVYEYDDRGNRTGWVSYKNGQPADSYQARYDDQSRQIWAGRYDAAGRLTSQWEYVYEDGTNSMTSQGKDGSKRVEYYHPDGRLLRIEDYESDGALSMVQEYIYRDIQVPVKEEAP